jgi:hypothetical protein
MARHYSRNLGEETLKGMLQKAKSGLYPSNLKGLDGRRTLCRTTMLRRLRTKAEGKDGGPARATQNPVWLPTLDTFRTFLGNSNAGYFQQINLLATSEYGVRGENA